MTLALAGEATRRLVIDRRYWLLPVALWSSLVGLSFIWNWSQLGHEAELAALNRAQFIFKMVESVRLWNARHGGLYAQVGGETVPNPYLKIPERDVTTTSGRALTLINPAYMTRQLAGVVSEMAGIRLHLTSLKPLNPGNAADPWETLALQSFERGTEEAFAFTGDTAGAVFRYMAPLKVVQACLPCHEQQGYEIGDIRGGISVSFPAAPIIAPIAYGQSRVAAIHLGIWLMLSALTVFGLDRFRNQLLSLKAAKEGQEAIVAERTAELRAEVRFRQEAEAQLRLLIESSGEAIIGVDTNGVCTLCNPEALRVLGYQETSELVGRDVHRLLEHSYKDESPRPLEDSAMLPAYREGQAVHVDGHVFWRADGSPFPVELRAHPLRAGDEILGAVITFADITERKTVQDRMWRQANFDGLTGLVNRRLFYDRLEMHLKEAERTGQGFGLIYVDLDGFKAVNDRLGHPIGDELLKVAAQRLTSAVRSSDTVARMGGDEFTIIVSEVDSREQLRRIMKHVRNETCGTVHLAGRMVRLGASFGLAYYPDDGDEVTALVRHADREMYSAKRHRHR